MNQYKGRKILNVKLHNPIFVGSVNYPQMLETDAFKGGVKAVNIEVKDSYIEVTSQVGNHFAIVPMTNVSQINLGPEIKDTKK